MAEISFNNVAKRFPDGTVGLHETSFKIDDGEFFILVGPSGCGKSTLLNMLVGLEDVSGGVIWVDGKPVNDLDPKDRNMAMVFQSYALYPHMSARQNIGFPLKVAKINQVEIARRVEQISDTLELTELLDRKPRSLSGGQRQRVAMARALIRRPEVFLLDEPLSNLDAKLRGQMRAEIANIQKRMKVTTVYVTHDQTEAMTLGDRIAVLRQGKVQQIGTPRELYARPHNLFVAGFLGSPAMNLLPARLEAGRIQLPIGDVDLPVGKEKQLSEEPSEAIAGIRPEDIRIMPASGSERGSGVMFQANVQRVEWLGAELLVHIDIECDDSYNLKKRSAGLYTQKARNGCFPFTVRATPVTSVQAGQAIQLGLDSSVLHLFDPATEQSLRPCI